MGGGGRLGSAVTKGLYLLTEIAAKGLGLHEAKVGVTY